MIVHRGRSWLLLTHNGSRVLGTHSSREAAVRQEIAIHAHQHARGNPSSPRVRFKAWYTIYDYGGDHLVVESLHVDAYAGSVHIGSIAAISNEFYDRISPECERSLRKIVPDVEIVFAVTESTVDSRWRNTGLGIELYTRLAEEAAGRFGAAVVANSCASDDTTSDDALRVWGSRRLAERVSVGGLAMAAVGRPRKPAGRPGRPRSRKRPGV